MRRSAAAASLIPVSFRMQGVGDVTAMRWARVRTGTRGESLSHMGCTAS